MSCSGNYVEYNFPRIKTNEGFKGNRFRVAVNGDPVDFTGWTAKVQFRKGSKKGEVGRTLTETDALSFDGDEVVIADIAEHGLSAAEWHWDLKLTDPDGFPHVWFGGVQPIEQGVTD